MKNDDHSCLVNGYNGSFPDLAFAIGNMAYDRTAELFGDWAERIARRTDGDGKKSIDSLVAAKSKLEQIWNEPYMARWREASAIKHPGFVVGYDGSLAELADALGNMEHHRIVLLINYLAADFDRQYYSDSRAGRKELASSLQEIVKSLQEGVS